MDDWLPDWRGQAAAILGCGPSLNQVDIDLLRGKCRIIAINEAWRLCPWADMLYACDAKWWKKRGPKPEAFDGLKVGLVKSDIPNVLVVEAAEDCAWSDDPGVVATGANSGFQALQLAAQAGADPVFLLGFDMTVQAGFHWHGKHSHDLRNPKEGLCAKWRQAFGDAEPSIKATVVNCTPASALECFPKMPVEEALARSGRFHRPVSGPGGFRGSAMDRPTIPEVRAAAKAAGDEACDHNSAHGAGA